MKDERTILPNLLIEDHGMEYVLVFSGIEIDEKIDYSKKIGLEVLLNGVLFFIPVLCSIPKEAFPGLKSLIFYEVYGTPYKRAIVEDKEMINHILNKCKELNEK